MDQEVAVDIGIKPVEFPLLVEKLDARPARFEFRVGALRLGHGLSLFRIETSLDEALGVEVGIGRLEVSCEFHDKGEVCVLRLEDCGDSFKVFLVMIAPRTR